MKRKLNAQPFLSENYGNVTDDSIQNQSSDINSSICIHPAPNLKKDGIIMHSPKKCMEDNGRQYIKSNLHACMHACTTDKIACMTRFSNMMIYNCACARAHIYGKNWL